MSYDTIRCLIEFLLIIPVLGWLWTIYVRSRKDPAAAGAEDATAVSTPDLGSEQPQPATLAEWDPRIEQLASAGDLYGLLNVLHAGQGPALKRDAADALTQMGSDEGLDYLIGLLESLDPDERYAAREILRALNDPRANAALQSHQHVQHGAQSQPAASASRQAGYGYMIDPQSRTGSVAGGDAWAAHFGKQTSLEGSQSGSSRQPPLLRTGRQAVDVAASGRSLKRLVQMCCPGALGSLLVVLGFAVLRWFANFDPDPEYRLPILFAELIYLPAVVIFGSVSGLTGYLLGQLISQALHLEERAQAVITMMGSLISGTLAGLSCDAVFLIAPYFSE